MEVILGNWLFFVLLGVAAGFFSGLLGVGSGIILIPVLVLLFNYPQKTAQGMALSVMIPMVLVGAVRYHYNPQVNLNFTFILLIAAGSIAGILISTWLIRYISNNMLRKIFAVFLIIAATRMFFITPGNKKGKQDNDTAYVQSTEK